MMRFDDFEYQHEQDRKHGLQRKLRKHRAALKRSLSDTEMAFQLNQVLCAADALATTQLRRHRHFSA